MRNHWTEIEKYLDTTVSNASVDLLFFEKTSGEFGARIIGPTKSRLSSYVVFEDNTSYIGIRFKPCYPIMISGIPVKKQAIQIDAQITMNVYNHIAEKSHVENEMSKMNLPETVPAVV